LPYDAGVIEFNVTPKRALAGPAETESLRERTARWWTCSDDKLTQFGDVAFAVEANLVSGVFRITGWSRDPATGKVELILADPSANDPVRGWIGHAAPVSWEPGQRQPFKYVTRRGLLPQAPTFAYGHDSNRLIGELARAGWRSLAQLLSRRVVDEGTRVLRAHETFHVVYRLAADGTPIPGGPRLLEPIPLPKQAEQARWTLAKAIDRLVNGEKVPPGAADMFVQDAMAGLKTIERATFTN
jgi:hypothetical protein